MIRTKLQDIHPKVENLKTTVRLFENIKQLFNYDRIRMFI